MPRGRGRAAARRARARACSGSSASTTGPSTSPTRTRSSRRLLPIVPTQRRLRSFGEDGEVLELRWPSEFEPLWSRAGAVARRAARSSARRAALDRSGSAARQVSRRARQPHRRRALVSAPQRRARHARCSCTATWAARSRSRSACFPCASCLRAAWTSCSACCRSTARGATLRRGLRGPAFPSGDRALHDRRLSPARARSPRAARLSEREGAGALGVIGTSLGGYSSALLATLEPSLRFAVLFIPLGSIDEFVHSHGGLPGEPEQQRELDGAARARAARGQPARAASLVPPRARRRDRRRARSRYRPAHSRLLAQHFGVPVHTFPGGHILQLGRDAGLCAGVRDARPRRSVRAGVALARSYAGAATATATWRSPVVCSRTKRPMRRVACRDWALTAASSGYTCTASWATRASPARLRRAGVRRTARSPSETARQRRSAPASAAVRASRRESARSAGGAAIRCRRTSATLGRSARGSGSRSARAPAPMRRCIRDRPTARARRRRAAAARLRRAAAAASPA